MRTSDHKLVCAVLCAILIAAISPAQLLAQFAAPMPSAPPMPATAPADRDGALVTARVLIKSGDYDRAIEMLRGLIEQAQNRNETLREAYLLLIKAHVYVGNDFKQKEQGRENARLNYDRAYTLIRECLQIRELRHTHPKPDSLYPSEMITAFNEARHQIFGSFRVTALSPPDAVVLFDADTLRTIAGENALGDVDLSVGKHLVVVRAPGYRDVTEAITIAPGITESRPYQLTKNRGAVWYATRAGAALGLVGGLVAILVKPGGGDGMPPAQPLGGPPPPPAGAR